MKVSLASGSRGLLTAAATAALLVALSGSVVAARPRTGNITVQQPVAHGEMTTATVNPGGAQTYVLAQCYTADGAYVYAAFSAVDSNNQASVGPLWSSLWMSGGANCTAQEGTFAKNGRWQVAAATTFAVLP